MSDLRKFGATSNLIRFNLVNSSTGQGLTGLTGSSSGLIISTINDVEATATAYTQASSQIQTIATLGTYAAPSASDCRFSQVDATNHPGLYEFQFADARFAVSNAQRLIITVSGAASLLTASYEIELVQFNPFDGVRLGLTAIPNVASGGAGALLVDGTGTAAISNTAGKVLLQATQTGVTIPTVTTVTNQLTAAQIATGVFQDTTAGDFTVANSIGKSLYTSGNAPGAANGIALVGSTAVLTAAGLDNVLIESGIVASANLENDAGSQLTSINARQALSLIMAACAAALSGAGTTTVTIPQTAVPASNTRVSTSVDSNGNRSSMVLKVPT